MRLILFLCLIFTPLLSFMLHGAQIPDSNLLLGKPGENTTIETRDGGTITRDQSASTWTASDKLISPVLEATSTSEASRPCPPMTEAQIGSATSSDGGCVYNTDRKQLNIYDAGTSSFKAITAGGSGGGGANFNNAFGPDENGNAESGTDGWTASAGTFSTDETDPIEGDQSFIWTPAAQNDTLTGPVLDFDRDVFRGRACQAQIDVIGGDENLTLQVIDGNSDVVAEKVYSAQTLAAPFSVYFRCPSQAKITADAQKGNLRLRLINSGASASPLIKWDKSYAGTLIGLSETVLPDHFSAKVDSFNNGGAVISQSSEFLESCSPATSNRIQCDFVSGINSLPMSCQFSPSSTEGNITSVEVYSFSATSFTVGGTRILGGAEGGQATGDVPFSVDCTRQGSDAKQSVQVYNSIPKVSENENSFSANGSSAGLVSSENIDWINGDCTKNSNGNFTCPVISGVFNNQPSCKVSSYEGASEVRFTSVGPGSISFVLTNSNGAASDTGWSLTCDKVGDDHKTATVQPVVLRENAIFFEGETDSLIGGYASFGGASDGSVCSASPCTRYREFGDLASNMSSTRTSIGRYTATVTGFKANSAISCDCVASLDAETDSYARACQVPAEGLLADGSGAVSLRVQTATTITSTPSSADTYFQVYCIGPKPL